MALNIADLFEHAVDAAPNKPAVKVGDRHRAVKAIARSERRWGKRAHAHLAVSKSMADWLAREYGVKAAVVYDRPSQAFARTAPAAAAALWDRIAKDTPLASHRPPLVVCPTSWTPDEEDLYVRITTAG